MHCYCNQEMNQNWKFLAIVTAANTPTYKWEKGKTDRADVTKHESLQMLKGWNTLHES